MQKPNEGQSHVIWHNNRLLIENGEDKYSVETASINDSYRCVSLFVSADESDDGSYYLCGDGQQVSLVSAVN